MVMMRCWSKSAKIFFRISSLMGAELSGMECLLDVRARSRSGRAWGVPDAAEGLGTGRACHRDRRPRGGDVRRVPDRTRYARRCAAEWPLLPTNRRGAPGPL